MSGPLPTLRWGIIGTGLISSWFCADLIIEREDAQANHIIQAIGSSSEQKGRKFVEQHLGGKTPFVYGSYAQVYEDPRVDIVYVGTPHSFHKQNCLDAIRRGKHVLCEKAFTLTAGEAQEVIAAAQERGVFIMEAMWTRFFPLVRKIQELVHEEDAVGQVHRAFCDFAMDQKISERGPGSRLRDPALGAGSLLDIGIYSLTWALLGLERPVDSPGRVEGDDTKPKILASQTLSDGVDVATAVILQYKNGRQGIATTQTTLKGAQPFCRIEGSKGTILVEGIAPSVPNSFVLRPLEGEEKRFEFKRVGKGFYWEADAVAQDIAAGRVQNEIMPWAETIRVLEMMDNIRMQGGARFPQDKSV